MKIKYSCPLGSDCEVAKDGFIERCSWYVEMRGQDSQGNDHDSWKCAIAWQPILQTEMSGSTRQVAASVQSLRNAQIKRQDAALVEIKSYAKKNALT